MISESSKNVGKDRCARAVRLLYIRASTISLSSNMIGPLAPYILVQYGGGASESGWFQALNNLLTNIGQVLWGRIGDICKFRKTLLTLGAASSIIMPLVVLAVLSIFGSINPHTIIMASALASLLGSASAPVLAPLIGDIAGEARRTAEILAALSNLSTAFSLIGGISATLLLQILTNNMLGYITLSATALMLSLTAIIFTVLVPRAVTESGNCKPFTRLGVAQEFKSFGVDIKRVITNTRFRGFVIANTVYNFSMSIAWPLFILTQRNVLRLTPAQVVSISVASNVSVIVSQHLTGKYLRRSLYKPLTLANRLGLVIVPLVYAYATSYAHLLILNIYTGVLIGFTNIVFPMYILESAEARDRALYTGVYNMFIGIATFAGSLLGGELASYAIAVYGLEQGLRLVYIVGTVARLASAVLLLRLKEFIF